MYSPKYRSKKYRITHHLEVTKEAAFRGAEATYFLALLSEFLSFCHGHHIATVLVNGLDKGGRSVYETYGAGRLSVYASGDGWMDRFNLAHLPALFSSFGEMRESEAWKETFKITLYWLWRGHVARAGCDAALILLQTALERLAWQALVLEGSVLSRTAFKRVKASANISMLLIHLGIPEAVPDELNELLAYAKRIGIATGPSVLAAVRNDLVHPEKRVAGHSVPYYEAYLLSRWYVEMIVLRLCEYQGKVHNYTRKDRWVGQVEDVPWARKN